MPTYYKLFLRVSIRAETGDGNNGINDIKQSIRESNYERLIQIHLNHQYGIHIGMGNN